MLSHSRRATLAMLFVGMAIFSGLYTTQALLPVLVKDVGLSTTEAALTVSAATGALSLCVVPASILSERFGRGRVLIIASLAAAAVGLVVPLAANSTQLILLRGLQGALMSGAPATAMAWLAEELVAADLARAMGIYIAGTSVGGLTGRLIPTFAVEHTSWRGAIWASAVVSLSFALTTVVLLPKQRNFHPKRISLRGESAAIFRHWRTPQLAGLFVVAFIAMGAFVSMYNFIGFRLIDHFGVPPVLAGFAFLFYLSGTWASARAGHLIARFGRRATLIGSSGLMAGGALATIGPLPVALAGLLALTTGFFAAHSTASGWVGALATADRAEASSMYVCCYYLGSSLVGAATGAIFDRVSWGLYASILAALSATIALIAAKFSD
ncbi:MFS transporter [Corynebacterium lizhenjunii]|uniref:MFS transporter n=1 Tax=Corynebacterium lizhenjunii TaxID=2709394 RepID=UPI001F181764|nr:MFS transporter [Corynebacterium lizhenjunii]